ncbi:nucleotidyltransferase family protein [uncultured Rhodospira sp.]|uniref:nucleotidyltransferase family protein n=1 Tax=uncultured Rhodospira sp. TaxID=1936189 RepID=UPI0026128D3E|nr:nucleotidyltransferase family protein [uncultured Rhodospira sp.]
MKPSAALPRHRDAILALSHRHGLRNVRVFGSAARGEDHDGSDLDLLVDPTPDVTTYFDIVDFKAEVECLLGVPVDVRTPNDLHTAFRQRTVSEAIPL